MHLKRRSQQEKKVQLSIEVRDLRIEELEM
jgi:hypothetical protein